MNLKENRQARLAGFESLDEASPTPAEAVGIDSGATLVKLAVFRPSPGLSRGSSINLSSRSSLDASLDASPAVALDLSLDPSPGSAPGAREQIQLATWPAPSTERVIELVRRLQPARIGVTGCGMRALAEGLGRPVARLLEFDAWGRGANRLLHEIGRPPTDPYLLVSIGTGTSALRVEGERVERIGGSALGGGTALGLGLALIGCRSHHELAALAARGQRGGVDLLISDIYESREIPLAGGATASSFGKLARQLDPFRAVRSGDASARPDATRSEAMPPDATRSEGAPPDATRPHAMPPDETRNESSARPEDLAAAVMGLVAENIALLCSAHARQAGVSTIVYGGSTLTENPMLIEIIQTLTGLLGQQALILPEAGHAGALGALLAAE